MLNGLAALLFLAVVICGGLVVTSMRRNDDGAGVSVNCDERLLSAFTFALLLLLVVDLARAMEWLAVCLRGRI